MEQNLLVIFCFLVILFGVISTQHAFAEIKYYDSFGSSGSGNNNLDNPVDVFYNEDEDLVYVADSGNNRINIFEDDGDYDSEFGTFCNISRINNCNDDFRDAENDGDGQFNNPIAVTMDNRENLYVVDSDNSRIQKFDGNRFDLKFGSDDSSDDDYLDSPQGIAILDLEKIFVSSRTTDSIHVFDYNGEFLYDFDSFDGESFANPSHLLIHDDMLYVSDSSENRIVIFELTTRSSCPSGTERVADGVCFVDTFGERGDRNGEFDSPTGLAIDESNDLLFVADTRNDRIQSFELTSRSCPSGTERVADGVCFVDTFGERGDRNGEFDSPTGLAIDESNDLLFVADKGNDRIQILEFDDTRSTSLESPRNLRATATSQTSITVSWDPPVNDTRVTGYKIEYREGSKSFKVLDEDTGNPRTMFTHSWLDPNTSYTYRVYTISSQGTSNYSSDTVRTKETTIPSGLIAEATSPSQIRLTWYPPSNTFGLPISGYEVKRVFSNMEYDDIGRTNSRTTTYVVSNLETDRSYSFAVSAQLSSGSSTNESNMITITPRDNSDDYTSYDNSYTEIADSVPDPPTRLTATIVSDNQINLSWNAPSGNNKVTGYKIQYKKDSSSFVTLVENTNNRVYQHTGISGSNHTYKVYAKNSAGIGASDQVTVITASDEFEIDFINKLSTHEERTITFLARVNGGNVDGVTFSLESNPPLGARINPTSGIFDWTPNASQGGTHIFDVTAKKGSKIDRQQVIIEVRDTISEPIITETIESIPEPPPEPSKLDIASFVDPNQDPQYYIDRYNNETAYKEWFDSNYPEYSIYQAVGLDEPPEIPASFVDPNQDPQYYIDRYNNETAYKEWFDSNYPEYSSIYEAVGSEPVEIITDEIETEPVVEEQVEPVVNMTPFGECGEGTELVDGMCVAEARGGGCLIATAAYGSEMTQQIQLLREIRDDQVMSTTHGTQFMTSFNQVYYSFSPQIADYQRENPIFRETVKIIITPLITSLGIMSIADSEQEILAYGIIVIMINLGMYVIFPIIAIHQINKIISQRSQPSI